MLPSSHFNFVQGMLSPEDIKYKTMKSMDRAAKLAMLPYEEAQCVDLWEGEACTCYLNPFEAVM